MSTAAPEKGEKEAIGAESIAQQAPANDSKEIQLEAAANRDQRKAEEDRLRLQRLEREYGATWDGPDDPNDPYNWSTLRKVSIGVIFSIGQLVTLMSASMMAAALDDISHDLRIDASTTQITFSTYFLGLAFAPFVIAAFSEMNGRKYIWVFCNVWYILWNSLCPIGNSKVLMIVGRFMTGAGASGGITLTGPVMADLYRAEDRGKSLAIASLLPYLGPALGPIVGGLVTQLVRWQWLFWTVSIFNAGVTLLGCICIKESYTPVLLRRKAAALRKNSSTSSAPSSSPSPWSREYQRDFFSRLSVYLLRPLRLLFKRPIIQVIALTLGLNFGIYTFILSTFATLWIDRYDQSKAISSLHYISISIGTTISAQAGGRAMDLIYRRLRDRAGGAGKPEFRAPYMIPGAILIPAGIFWYGWSAERTISWIMVDVGAAMFTCGNFMLSQALLAYQLDEFAEQGASANAASRVLSNVLGFAFPIFAPRLYATLGYGWGNSLLGFIFVALGCPVPLIIWVWGERLRAAGRKPAEHDSE